MAEHPRGVWVWRLGMAPADLPERLVQCKVGRVYLKVFDGRSSPMFWGFQCTPEIIQRFKSQDIEVYGWGYHWGTSDVDVQVAAVKMAFDAGIDGYVVDAEKEVEETARHANLEKLLIKLRPIVPAGTFGYTSFGHPGFHPKVPWKILDKHCDMALPQIYFEKFRFKATNEEEVQDCLKAHSDLGLSKPIMPIWGSESDATNPATAGELQTYLNRFPGSSVWRVPNEGERGEALKLNYGGAPLVPVGGGRITRLPKLTRLLVRGVIGDDVTALQKALQSHGYSLGSSGVDGDFGPDTENAVRAFQLKAGLTVDGEVGPDTWGALGGDSKVVRPEQGKLTLLADIARIECDKRLSWKNATSEAEQYLKPLREPMRRLHHIGSAPVFYDWCAAFVTWCCRKAGFVIPDQPEGFWATMALVDSWRYWAKTKGFWHPAGGRNSSGYVWTATGDLPRRGDILTFEWFDTDPNTPDHIGIVRGYVAGSQVIQTSEGNRGNLSVNGNREMRNVSGFIRLVE